MAREFAYPLAAGALGSEELAAADAVLRSGHYTMGWKVEEFETALAQWIGVKHAIMVNSGSSANLLLVDSLLRRLRPEQAPLQVGDEVLVPALSWPTTVWPLLQLGLVPVYTDVDPQTLAICLDSAEAMLSPRTKAMFLIHVLGQACRMKSYTDFCQKHGLVLLEDCCESFGAFDEGRHVGTFGHGGTLSHYYSHHLTTIEGGTIITNDAALADDLRSMRSHGWIRPRTDRAQLIEENPEIDPRFCFIMPGYNVRPIEIQGAIGVVQLGRMDKDLRAREQLVTSVAQWTTRYVPWMQVIGAGHLATLPGQRRERRHSWMMIPFLVDADAPMDVNEVKRRFEACGVDTRPVIAGNLTHHPGTRYGPSRKPERMAVADTMLHRAFMIGCHTDASAEGLRALQKAFEVVGSSLEPRP